MPIAAGLAAAVVFIRRQRQLADPLVDVRLFRQSAFSAALAINTFGFFVLMGIFFFLAQYLQLVRAARRYLGEKAAASYLAEIDQPVTKMMRIGMQPAWVGVLDFQQRLPDVMGGITGER